MSTVEGESVGSVCYEGVTSGNSSAAIEKGLKGFLQAEIDAACAAAPAEVGPQIHVFGLVEFESETTAERGLEVPNIHGGQVRPDIPDGRKRAEPEPLVQVTGDLGRGSGQRLAPITPRIVAAHDALPAERGKFVKRGRAGSRLEVDLKCDNFVRFQGNVFAEIEVVSIEVE